MRNHDGDGARADARPRAVERDRATRERAIGADARRSG